jgi:transposase
MLSLSTSARLYIHCAPADMRKSLDGLSALAREAVGEEPVGGSVFIFANRRGDRLKVLFWDGNGFCVLYKRLERGRFSLPPEGSGSVCIDERTFRLLLGGISLERHWKTT